MEVDSLSSSHPVSTPVENPTQIQEMFDDVSYDKVSFILSEDPRFVVDALGYWSYLSTWSKVDSSKVKSFEKVISINQNPHKLVKINANCAGR